MIKSIVFVVGSKIQWENFIAVSILLKKKYKIHFVLLDHYDCYSYNVPKINNGIKFSILEKIIINKALYFCINRKFFKRFLPIFSLKKVWKDFLNVNNPNLVVFGVDHSIIHSYMINICKQKSIKSAVLQDGYIVTRILKGNYWKNKLGLLSRRFNLYFPYTPTPFKSGIDFIGLIGDEAKECLDLDSSNKSNTSVVGSPRYENFIRKANEYSINLRSSDKNNIFENDYIVFMQTNYDYVNVKLEKQQQDTIVWLCETIQKLKFKKKMMVHVFLHTGTNNTNDYINIQKRFKETLILVSGGINPTIIDKSYSCFTMGSSGIIDFYLAKVKCAVLISPNIKNPLLVMGILEFGFPLIQSDNKLSQFLNNKSFFPYEKNKNKVHIDKVANFNPKWNSIQKTVNWISSLIEKK